jgi:phosphohistidine phosphatase
MRDHIQAEGVRPDLVLCSPAARTRQTLERVRAALGSPRIVVEDELYTFDAGDVLARLAAVADDVVEVMVVGHNPAIEGVASSLAAGGPGLAELRAKYPTGALAELELAIESWASIGPGCGRLVSFTTPNDLG